jgi:hypothetical protein
MPRWFLALSMAASIAAGFACNDDTIEQVPKDVCYTGERWVGDKRGTPEMFPGRDCVGCHIENDGPPLAIGGTIYPYVLSGNAPGLVAQTGTDCLGVENVHLQVEDANGLVFDLYTNSSGNFYVEGNPDDFAKPFTARILWTDPETDLPKTSGMSYTPSYGGCANCHNPYQTAHPAAEDESPDKVVIPQARIGLPGNGPGDGFDTIEDELNVAGCKLDMTNTACARLFTRLGIPLPTVDPQ